MELWKNFEFKIESNRYKCQTKRNQNTIFELYIDGKEDSFHYRDMEFSKRDQSLIMNPIIVQAIKIIIKDQKKLKMEVKINV